MTRIQHQLDELLIGLEIYTSFILNDTNNTHRRITADNNIGITSGTLLILFHQKRKNATV